MTEDEIVGWHHRLNGHEFKQALGDGEGQGGLVGCSRRGCKELDMTEQLNKSLSCVQLICDPMDCSPPRSSVHGMFQARILEGVAISFSRVST